MKPMKDYYTVTIEPDDEEEDLWESEEEAEEWAIQECKERCPEAYEDGSKPERDRDYYIRRRSPRI